MASVDSNEDSKDLFHFVYGDESVAYEVIRKPFAEGKKKKITIKVHPDGRAIVTAPTDAEQQAIHDAVVRRAKWIWDALTEFLAVIPNLFSPSNTSVAKCCFIWVDAMY